MDKYIGRLLDNRYEILEVIGTGGMAVVYKARCHRLNRLVAIKILKNDYLEDEDFRRRFHAESQAVAMLSHPNIVSVYDVSTSVSLEADYIVMELIEGITLKQYMEKKGVLNWKETLHFAMQIAKALEHAHSRGIVHRDIKPHNVMVLKNGSVKVTDFGIARLMSKGDTLTKEALGSVHYISPEQAKGGRVDDRSDIYSLGVVMYEMMAGRPPYEGESPVAVAIQHINGGAVMPSTLNPNIPGGIEQIIMKAMAHELSDRYATATAMLADMDEFRKDPTLLFDYNVPPIDVVTTLHKVVPPTPEPPKPAPTGPQARRDARRQAAEAAASAAEAARRKELRRKQEQVESRGNRVATVAIIVCCLVIVVAIGVFLVLLLGGGLNSYNSKLVEVPDLLGKYEDALKAYPGLDVKVNDRVFHETYKEGQIVDQNPKAGDRVVAGTTVHITVSKGQEEKPVTMPSLAGMTKLQAEAALKTCGIDLTWKFEEQNHETVELGQVISTDPAENTELTPGQSVTVYLSAGPETKTINMPNLVTQKIDIVTNILLAYGFPEPDITYVYSSSDSGTVLSQSVEKGTQVRVDTVIRLEVSKGAEPVFYKDVTIDLTGYITQANTYVLIKRGNTEVYNQAVGPETTSVTLYNQSGNGTVSYSVYVDDQLVKTEKVTFG